MIAIPADISRQYDTVLSREAIAKHYRPHYRKWLRFYLDFCQKYGFSIHNRNSFHHYNNKLQEKGQSESLRRQAHHAVKLYFQMMKADTVESMRDENISESRKQARSRTNLSSSPEPEVAVVGKSTIGSPHKGLCTNSSPVTGGKKQPFSASTIIQSPRHVNDESFLPSQGANWEGCYEQLEASIKLRHYSLKTLSAYRGWTRKLQTFVKSKDPQLLGAGDVKAFLSHLAVEKKVSASSQNQAFNALLFLFRHVLGKEFGQLDGVVRAKRKPYIPVVLSRAEIDQIFVHLSPPYDLIGKLLYGCGLRLFECMKLRVQDLNLEMAVLTVHDGKGKKDRAVPLPEALIPALKLQMEAVRYIHSSDLADGYDGTFLPDRLAVKYKNAATEYSWQWLFPAKTLTLVPDSGKRRRYHLHDTHVQKAIKAAVKHAQISKRASAHTFRHSFASHLLQANYDIRTIQELLGHSDVKTTMIYTHTVRSRTLKEAKSPLDF